MTPYKFLKNIAVVAHVDHGKTTMVDGLLQQSGTSGERDEIQERVMDSGELKKKVGSPLRPRTVLFFGMM